jgi:hypothetical protein
MARYESKSMQRITDINAGTDIFKTERLQYDLSSMRFLWAGVDTIRQLYICNLKTEVFSALQSHFDTTESNVIELGGYEWKLSSSGKKSGYQYIFKNLDLGFVVLFKSFYIEANERGAHLKIEATPQIIDRLGLSRLTHRLREIAAIFADTLEASGVAVHLACDMKGLDVPENFEEKLVTRSKRSFKAHGITDISAVSISETNYTYGRGETYTFGSASALQMSLYDKTREAIKSDKLSFCESLWRRTPSLTDILEPEYKDGSDGGEVDQVHRLEFRIHHSIIRQFEHGNYNMTGNLVCIREPVDLLKHIQALWDYCLNNFRLQHSDTYIHPIWQKISEDVRFAFLDGHEGFMYKRASKKSDVGCSRRNVAMWLGNVLKLSARKGLRTDYVVKQLLSSGLDSDLSDYFGLKLYGHTEELIFCLRDFVDNKLREHRLSGVAA